MLSAENISKSFYSEHVENRVLKDISIAIENGRFVCVVGRSGSGKSTLLNVLSTLLKPEKGTITFAGQDITNLPENKLNRLRHNDFSMIFQFHHLMAYLTAVENVLLPYMNSIKPIAKDTVQRARECLDRVGLNGKYSRLPGQLSGGEQQRVAIARALVKSPQVLFADEPTGNLDKATGDEIIKLLKNLHKDGLTVIMVTHDLSYTPFADRVVEMEDGVINEVTAGDLRM
jgi:putative ABC transport system ATP-binding protein